MYDTHATTAAIDLAKNVYQVILADARNQVSEQRRLTRTQFERFFANRSVERVIVMTSVSSPAPRRYQANRSEAEESRSTRLRESSEVAEPSSSPKFRWPA
jgi:hypothetical protein